ncbi:IPT/TIG domain-containing protein [Paractinoplanes toevensis]|uniref:IPT/TIG domain-containing protein n=1 Tax=Paractinoplanes toevensis TaxID=571911 RepID=UPI001BB42C01|nr:IPT/TIG domain-containing protein [Actinoplanes toevensis]
MTPDVITLSSSSGPTGGGNTLTLTSTGTNNQFVEGSVFVEFKWETGSPTACSTSYVTPTAVVVTSNATSAGVIAATNVRVVSPTKLAVVVPSDLILGSGNNNTTEAYNVCVYNTTNTGTANSLLAQTSGTGVNYNIGAVAPTVSTVYPTAGPSQGGNTVTITGTGFLASATTASIGGVPLTGITATTTSITGTAPAHSAGGPYAVTVQVTGGANASKKAAYTYSDGIVVSPNTAPNTKTTATEVSVTGSGFYGNTFSTTSGPTPDDANTHVFLVKGTYDPTKTTAGTKTNGQVTECLNVLVISNNELLCSLYLAGNGIPQASLHAVTGTTSGTTLTLTVGSFTQGDVGMAVTGAAGLGTGNYIASVIDSNRAILAKTPTAALTAATVLSVNPTRTFADATLTNGSNVITSAANANFTSADVGRAISGASIPGGTTITAVNSATSATLSANANGSASSTYTVSYAPTPVPVPNGQYVITVVNNGNIDAQPGGTKADTSYYQTAVNSGASFTVADF